MTLRCAVHTVAWLLVAGGTPALALASLGPFEHGSGIKSQGAGGVGYALGEESTVLPLNPALIAGMDERNDLGLSLVAPFPTAELVGNLFGRSREYDADGQRLYPIPQGGMVRHLDERWSMGVSLFAAGLGPDYTESPFERFGGAARSNLTLVSTGVSTALALRITPDHAFGAAVNLGYQMIRVEGLQFLSFRLPPFRASEQPDQTTNHGFDGRLNIGFSLGWQGLLTPRLTLGLGYRSKTYTEKHKDYRGLLPEGGSLELPAIWGVGLAWMPWPRLTLSADMQEYEFEHEKAFGNGLQNFLDGNRLGSDNGPGFGFHDQTATKFGVVLRASDTLTLRAGYITADQPVQSSDTLFPILGSITTTTHYTLGLSWQRGTWELSCVAAYAPEQKVRGEGSIPLLFGGGEANLSFEVLSVGVSLGWGIGGD